MTKSAAPGWTPVTPSIPSCWSRRSTNSSRTREVSNSPFRACLWSATAPVQSSPRKPRWTLNIGGGTPGSRCSSPKASKPWQQLGCSVLMEIGPQPVLTGAALQVWPELLGRAEGDRLAAQGHRCPASDRRGAGRGVCRRASARVRRAAPSATAQVRTAHLSVPAPSLLAQDIRHAHRRRAPYPESWAAQRISLPATPSTPAGCPSRLSRGWSITSSMAPSLSRARRTRRWPWPRSGRRRRCSDVFFYEPIILPDKSSREVQLTLHPVEDGGWTFQVHSRPYGERDAEWSLNADGRSSPVSTTSRQPSRRIPSMRRSSGWTARVRRSCSRPSPTWNWPGGPPGPRSLKSLWVGDGEAVGDVVVGDELAEQLGTEPIHPVLLDLCTGVAFPAFPALLAAEQGVADLFLPLRYGRVMLREKMPRRFYCRARWHVRRCSTAKPRSSTSISWTGMAEQLGGIREFTVKRAPREALLRGLGGDATRLLYTLGWHEVPPPESSDDRGGRHLADRRIRRTGRRGAGLYPVRPDGGSGAVAAGVGAGCRSAVRRSPASSGAAPDRPAQTESAAEFAERGWRPRSPSCSAPCTRCNAAR